MSARLSDLPSVALTPDREAWRARLATRSGGPAPWRARKDSEVRTLLALAQLAPTRLEVLLLDSAVELRAMLRVRVAVPCRPDPAGDVVVRDQALLGLTYPEEAVRHALPGAAFVQLLAPARCWHPNVAFDTVQPICLGPSLPAGIPAVELVLASYAALSLQVVTLDEHDAGGVLNLEATRYWQTERQRIPLSREPFLAEAS